MVLLLDVLRSVVLQPIAFALYVGYLLFSGAVSWLLAQLTMPMAATSDMREARDRDRHSSLAMLNKLMLRRGVTAMAVVASTLVMVGVIGVSYTQSWSMDTVVAGLLVIVLVMLLFAPTMLIQYVVYRHFLLSYGHFVPSHSRE